MKHAPPIPKRTAGLNLSIDRGSDVSLQEQIRRKIVDGIAAGLLPSGMRLPSSRQLSTELGVSRNTIAAVFDKLVDDGHLVSRDRSGFFVRETGARRATTYVSGPAMRADVSSWQPRLSFDASLHAPAGRPPDWEKYPFPFIDGPFDHSLFPVTEWREATRRALSVSDIDICMRDAGDADDPMLLAEIQRKVLPWRGIHARPEEILITNGAQQSLYLVTELFARKGITAAVEEPGNPELRTLLRMRGAGLECFAVDEEGMEPVADRLETCDMVFVSPGRQLPVGTTMNDARRQTLLEIAAKREQILVEHDYHWEGGFTSTEPPALRGTPGGEQVIYAATLAKPLAPVVRLGILVGPAPVIRAARALRRITSRHPALSLQRTFAYMLALGHYAKALHRVERTVAQRMIALREALNFYLPTRISILSGPGDSCAWILGPAGLDVERFTGTAESRGALIEPVHRFYARSAPAHVFRLGITGIDEARIREGVAVVSHALRDTMDPAAMGPQFDPSLALTGTALRKACSGATLLCKTVYGDPCTIYLAPDGTMSGRAGFANEEHDHGKWWIDGDHWCRKWHEWAYGETARFRVIITADRIQWFLDNGRLIDQAIIVRRTAANPRRQPK